MPMSRDTIAAIATAQGRGGVGIVRVSGKLAKSIAEQMTGRELQPRYAHYGPFYTEQQQALDQGLALYFAGPNSFTGEDVLELQGHGGPVVLDMLLQRCVELGARLARPGEFSERAFLNDKLDLAQAEAIAEQLLTAFKEPFKVLQYELFITASIGIAHHQDAIGNAVQLLKHADLALYRAKKMGRNGLVSFNTDLATDAALRQQLTDELRHALSHNEFELFYQPQVDSKNCPIAMEALLRWRSGSRGLVGPDKFIPLLEETGMILDVSRWVFRTACRQATAWSKQGTPLRIAVNLSPLDFLQTDLAGSLLSIMQEEHTPARLIELEITENSLLDSGAQVKNTLAQLKAAGLLLFLDDFGTGYSSLTYIKRFQFDGIKIDREFVAGLPNCQQSIALIQGILTIAKHLGLEVVAEGVETAEQANFLRQQGCQRLQGYYFSAAQPAIAHFTSTHTLKLY